MNQSETKSAALSVRDVPEPLGVCLVCGATPAVMDRRGHYHRCAPCHVREVLEEAAAAHLRQLLTPALGAWADHWTHAGIEPDSLAEMLEHASGAWMDVDSGKEHRREIIRDLLEHHRPPAYQDPGPERTTVHLEQLHSRHSPNGGQDLLLVFLARCEDVNLPHLMRVVGRDKVY